MKLVLFVLSFFFSFSQGNSYAQEFKFMLSGGVRVKDFKYDPEVPFAQNQDPAELYVQLVVNDSVIKEWGPTNNSNELYINSTQITLKKNQKVELKCFDEDERKSAGINKDDELIRFQIPEDSIYLSNTFFGDLDTHKFILRFNPMHTGSFRIVSFTPTQPYKGIIKKGMKKEGLRWQCRSDDGRLIQSEIIKSTTTEKLVWKTDSCRMADCYSGKPISIDAFIGGKYYIYFLLRDRITNPYELKWGDDVISTEYGEFAVRLNKT